MTTSSAHDQAADSGAPVQRDANESSASVLIVEDNEDTRLLLKTLLESRGARVVEASDGEMALALAANLRLDLILMDGSLPLLDGLETMRRIRELASMSGVPIIFVSGHAQPAAQASAFAAGRTDYLIEPIDSGAWDRVLERHLAPGKAI